MKQFIIILSLVLLSNSVFAEMYFCEETYKNGFNDSEDKREYKPVDRFSVSTYTIVRTEKEVCLEFHDHYDLIDKVYSASESNESRVILLHFLGHMHAHQKSNARKCSVQILKALIENFLN